MQLGLRAARILGAVFLLVAAAAAIRILVPVPREVFFVDVSGASDGPRWSIRAESPRQALAGQEVSVSLDVRPVGPNAGAGRDLIVASLAAPGAKVAPVGDQVAPATDPVGFEWRLRADRAGPIQVTPSLAVRDPDGSEHVVWARPFDMETGSVIGLDRGSLTEVGLGSGLLGGTLLAVWFSESRRWRRPEAGLLSSP